MLEATTAKPSFKDLEAIYRQALIGLLEPNDVSGAAVEALR